MFRKSNFLLTLVRVFSLAIESSWVLSTALILQNSLKENSYILTYVMPPDAGSTLIVLH